jgi:hypothetical protein
MGCGAIRPFWVNLPNDGKGDTLVVQTIGIRNDEWLDARGTPITDSAKITERFRGQASEPWDSMSL